MVNVLSICVCLHHTNTCRRPAEGWLTLCALCCPLCLVHTEPPVMSTPQGHKHVQKTKFHHLIYARFVTSKNIAKNKYLANPFVLLSVSLSHAFSWFYWFKGALRFKVKKRRKKKAPPEHLEVKKIHINACISVQNTCKANLWIFYIVLVFLLFTFVGELLHLFVHLRSSLICVGSQSSLNCSTANTSWQDLTKTHIYGTIMK